MRKEIIHKFSTAKYFMDRSHLNLTIESDNSLGKLSCLENLLANNGINLTYIKSCFSNVWTQNKKSYLDISIKNLPEAKIDALKQNFLHNGIKLNISKPIPIPWFPRTVSDLNSIGKTLIKARDDEANQDHPQFTDKEYRKRRDFIADVSHNYKMGERIPDIPYTKEETDLWVMINAKLGVLHQKVMSQLYLRQKAKIQKNFSMSKRIPQLNQLSEFLKSQTGFTIKPTHGILSQREFLNCLAFKVFCCTQYLRHVSGPDYTPQPDIVHEIVGHIATFADPYVAEISQRIGILSLGATDEQIAHLGSLYWYTLQFGACLQGSEKKVYGAGIAGCVSQIQHFMSEKAVFLPFNPYVDYKATFPIQSVQPSYRLTHDFQKALEDVEKWGSEMLKPITTTFNYQTQTVEYDRNIEGLDSGDKPIEFV